MERWKVTRWTCDPEHVSIAAGRGEPRPAREIAGLEAAGYRYDGASAMGPLTVYRFTHEGPGLLVAAESPAEAWAAYDEIVAKGELRYDERNGWIS